MDKYSTILQCAYQSNPTKSTSKNAHLYDLTTILNLAVPKTNTENTHVIIPGHSAIQLGKTRV
jgi:hypothetical protein